MVKLRQRLLGNACALGIVDTQVWPPFLKSILGAFSLILPHLSCQSLLLGSQANPASPPLGKSVAASAHFRPSLMLFMFVIIVLSSMNWTQ